MNSWLKTFLVGLAGVFGGFLGLICGVLIWWPIMQIDWGIFSGIPAIATGMFASGFGAMKAGNIVGHWLDYRGW